MTDCTATSMPVENTQTQVTTAKAETETSMGTFEFQLVAWRLHFDPKLGMSLDFDDKNNWVRVSNDSENSLSGKKNQIIRGIPELCEQDLRPGDFV